MTKIVSLKPLFDCLVIKPFSAKKQTESGIIIPENSQKKPNLAQVIEVGPNCKSGIKAGDYIVTPKSFQATTDIEVNEDVVSIIKEENVVAVVNIEEK